MSADRGAAKVLYLSEEEVKPLITPAEALEHAETAFRLYAQSLRGQIPSSFSPMVAYHTTVPNSDVDFRSGSMASVPTLCSTLGFGYADNPSKFGLSSMHSFAVLTDVQTGVPKCIMAQGSFFISFLRTGARRRHSLQVSGGPGRAPHSNGGCGKPCQAHSALSPCPVRLLLKRSGYGAGPRLPRSSSPPIWAASWALP